MDLGFLFERLAICFVRAKHAVGRRISTGGADKKPKAALGLLGQRGGGSAGLRPLAQTEASPARASARRSRPWAAAGLPRQVEAG